MKHKLLALIGCLVIAISLSACSGIGGNAGGIPTMGNAVTDIGNPNDEAELMKGLYVNDVYEVAIRYPADWSVEEKGTEEALFSSQLDDSMTASFVRIDEQQTVEDFILSVRSDMDGLDVVYAPAFDKTYCAGDSNGFEDGKRIVECYYFRADEDKRFVMVLSGLVEDGADKPTVVELNPAAASKSSATNGPGPVMELVNDAEDEGDDGLTVMSETTDNGYVLIKRKPTLTAVRKGKDLSVFHLID